ncbi:ABC transporter permease [Candidatus Woesearchaeota archaeon]|nr:ABC transporter permease [Candidatus Woesearchaeota archaeon]
MGAWGKVKKAASWDVGAAAGRWTDKYTPTFKRTAYGMYDIAARTVQGSVAGGFWLFLAALLFVLDTGFFNLFPATQFNVLDPMLFFRRAGYMGIVDLLLAPIVLTFVLIYTFTRLGRVSPKQIISKWFIAGFFWFILLYAGTLGSIIHLIFAVIFWLGVLIPIYGEDADRILLIFMAIDFFGASLIAVLASLDSQAAFSMVENILFFPIWLLFVTFNPNIKMSPALKFLSVTFIVVILVFNGAARSEIIYGLVTGEAVRAPEGFRERLIGARDGIREAISRATKAQLEYATGGYYEGEVEKAQKEPLGVYIEDIKPADKQFYEDESVTVWATLKVNNLDKDEPVGVDVSCLSDKGTDKKKDGVMLPESGFEIYTLEEEDLQCKFEPGDLEKGSRKVSIFADFNFKTMAYLKNYFMDEERLRSMRRDDVDVFKHFGISDTKPIAKYTPGPVRIGIESKAPPVGLSTEYDAKPLLGITLENEGQWQGHIKKINDLIVCIPKSMELDLDTCDAAFVPYNEPDVEEECGEEHTAYKLEDHEKAKEKYKNIKEYVSFRCRLLIRPEKVPDVLGGVPFATKFFRVTADYDYQLEKSTVANVVRTPGFNAQLTPMRATVNDELTCVGTHDKKNIAKVKCKFVKIDESGDVLIDPPGEREVLATQTNSKRIEVDLPKGMLGLAGIKKDSKVRCIMEATLGDGTIESDSSTITIKNTPPTVKVNIQKPASDQQNLMCNGTVEDIDGDVINVDWEFTEGYFDSDTCKGLRSGQVCKTKAIPKEELSVGERIRCKMTPEDDEVRGATKEDYVVISS